MQKAYTRVFLTLSLLGFAFGWFIAAPQAQPKPTWIKKSCFTLEEVTNVLNALSPEQADSAKVIAINSQRSFLGVMSSPYYVYYHNTPK